MPLAVTEASDRINLLRGHAGALREWAAAGADLLMGGHIHLPYTLAPNGLARQLWVVQAGTAVSTRTRPGVPNSVNMVRWGDSLGGPAEPTPGPPAAKGSCLIEQWDFARELQAFVRAAVTEVQPHRQA